MTRTVEHGRAAGVWSVLSLETGLLLHVLLAAAGVSALIASSDTALTTLRVAGACFLAYLGVRSWRRRGPAAHRPGRRSSRWAPSSWRSRWSTTARVAGRLSRRLRTPEAQGRLSGTSGVVYLGLAGLALAG